MFQFAGHTLDVARSSLRAADREIVLRPKSLEVLLYLVENAGRLITKDELLSAIWPNVIVTEDSLTHCVSEIRDALGDEQRRVVKTVSRRGYLFAAPVSRLSAPARSAATAVVQPTDAPIDSKAEPPLPDRPSISFLP